MIDVTVKDGYLSIVLPAYESPEKTEAEVSAIYDAVQKHGARMLFIDCRATKQRIPLLELYELCIFMVSTLGPLRPKIAALVSPEAAYPDRFGENVLRNRGLDVIRFLNDEHAAMQWLIGAGLAPPR